MIAVRQTARLTAWFGKLRDLRARAHIIRRIERAEDVKLVGASGKCGSIMGPDIGSISFGAATR